MTPETLKAPDAAVTSLKQNPSPPNEIVIGVLDNESLRSLARDQAREQLATSDQNKSWPKKLLAHLAPNLRQALTTEKVFQTIKKEGQLYQPITTDQDSLEQKKLAALTASQNDLAAITERLLLPDDEGVQKEAGESKHQLTGEARGEVLTLITKFASHHDLAEALFRQELQTTLEKISSSHPEIIEQTSLIAENLWQKITDLRSLLANGLALEQAKLDTLEIYLAKVKAGVRTTSQPQWLEQINATTQKIPLVRSLSNLLVPLIAGSVTAGTTLGHGAAYATGGLAGGVAVSAGFSYFNEGKRARQEKAIQDRDLAQGRLQESATPNEIFSSSRVPAQEILTTLRSLTETNLDQNLPLILDALADLQARESLSNLNQLDLITYSQTQAVEQERTNLIVERARLKTSLKKHPDWPTLKNQLEILTQLKKTQFQESLKKQDQLFTTSLRRRQWRQAGISAALATATNLATQEIMAFNNDQSAGLIESLVSQTPPTGEATTLKAGSNLIENLTTSTIAGANVPPIPTFSESFAKLSYIKAESDKSITHKIAQKVIDARKLGISQIMEKDMGYENSLSNLWHTLEYNVQEGLGNVGELEGGIERYLANNINDFSPEQARKAFAELTSLPEFGEKIKAALEEKTTQKLNQLIQNASPIQNEYYALIINEMKQNPVYTDTLPLLKTIETPKTPDLHANLISQTQTLAAETWSGTKDLFKTLRNTFLGATAIIGAGHAAASYFKSKTPTINNYYQNEESPPPVPA